MKRLIISILTLSTITVSAGAQSAEEIISRMEDVFSKHEKDGIEMIMDTKMFLINLSIKTYTLGEKTRFDTKILDYDVITWSDEKTTWEYTIQTNEVKIENNEAVESESKENEGMFSDINEGYNVSIKKQTDKAWYIQCTKSKTNMDKEAPKNMQLVVAKETYYPISLTAKVSGIEMTMRDIVFGVDEKTVTFNQEDYPDVKIIDKRL